MTSKKTFSVAAIGIPANEQRILKNIFKLSAYRARSYTLSELSFESSANILIVNGDDANAMLKWLREQDRNTVSIPALIVSRTTPSAPCYHTRRPLIATRVLGVLDQIAIKELSFIPEMMIGEETESTGSATKNLQKTAPVETKQPRFRALVVDDSLSIRKQLELELNLFGAQTDFAETGEQAFQFLERNRYDIIFLDVVLPGVDGYTVCKSIKKQTVTKRTPVVMLTGKSSPFDRVRGKLSGCSTYLTKPASHESFQQVVKKYLS